METDEHDKYLQNIFEFVIYSSENESYVSNLKLTSCDFGVTRRLFKSVTVTISLPIRVHVQCRCKIEAS